MNRLSMYGILLFLILSTTSPAQTDLLFSEKSDSVKSTLKTGLTSMLMLMKEGKRDQAFLWFKKHYFQLHQYRLLQDSLLKSLYLKQLPDEPVPEVKVEESDSATIKKAIQRQIRKLAYALKVRPGAVVPDSFVHNIERYIHLYRKNKTYRVYFETAVRRSRKFIPVFKPLFGKYGFPEELIYFIAVESAFNPNAISKAGAAGMFQFMPATAREYGLTVNPETDERFFVMKSAAAAAEYLKDLYLELGDINLTFAAYNTGPNKIRRLLKKLNSIHHRTYWQLTLESEELKSETREYLPQIYAVMTLANPENTSLYGFPDIPFVDTSTVRVFRVKDSRYIKPLVERFGADIDRILKLNPELESIDQIQKEGYLDYPLFIPRELNVSNIVVGGEEMETVNRRAPVKVIKKKKVRKTYDPGRIVDKKLFQPGDTLLYVVQRGNTLHMLARMFHVTVHHLKKVNGLKFKSLRKGTVLKIPVTLPLERLRYSMPRTERYVSLAERFGVNSFDLKHINPNKSATLEAGDTVLVIRPLRPEK